MDGERNLTRGTPGGGNVPKAPSKEELRKDINSKVLKPVAKRQEKSFAKQIASEFIQKDFGEILKFGITEVVVPGAKDLIYNWGTRVLEMALFNDGEAPRSYRGKSWNSGGGFPYHNRFGAATGRGSSTFGNAMPKPVSDRDRIGDSFEHVTFSSMGVANEVFADLYARLHEYGVVTVAQFYQLSDYAWDIVDGNWGWNELPPKIHPRRVPGGEYVLDLPRPQYLRK